MRVAAVLAALLAAGQARAAPDVVAGVAAPDVVVGAVYPAGSPARAAIETALDIVNTTHDPLAVLMGRGGGLERLGGARLRVVFADGGDPAAAAAAADRLAGSEHAVALLGGEDDAVAAAIGDVAERRGLPYISLDATGTELTNRGTEWFFRVGASRAMTEEALFRYLAERKLGTVALVSDHGADGRAFGVVAAKLATAASIKVVADLKAGPDTAEAALAAKPDAVVPAVGLAEAVPLVRQLVAARPAPAIVAPGGGFLPGEFLTGLGQAADGVAVTTGFAADALAARPAIPPVNAAFRARTGRDLDEAAARELTGTLLLADVIDRAGSTAPADLRIALMATDTGGEETLMAWDGIRFDANGQNVRATQAVQRVRAGAWVTVAPPELAPR